VRTLKGKSLRNVTWLWTKRLHRPEFAAAAVEGAILGDYEPDQLKTDPKKGRRGWSPSRF
jgi:Leucyl aminopeptidase